MLYGGRKMKLRYKINIPCIALIKVTKNGSKL